MTKAADIECRDDVQEPAETPQAPPAQPQAETGGEWYFSSGPPQAMRWLAVDFTHSLAAAASGLLRCDLLVHLTAAAETSRAHFLQTVEEPTCCCELSASGDPARPPGEGVPAVCLEFSPAIAFAVVERLLGAAGDPSQPPQRALTDVERRVLGRLGDLAAASLAAVWPAPARPGFRAREAAAAPDEEPVIVFTFELTGCCRVGTMRLCVARPLVECASLARRRATMAPLELSAALEGITVDGDDLAEMREGDILAMEVPADGEIVVRVGGIPKFGARLGTRDGKKALTITRRLD